MRESAVAQGVFASFIYYLKGGQAMHWQACSLNKSVAHAPRAPSGRSIPQKAKVGRRPKNGRSGIKTEKQFKNLDFL
jgi:hypothetical protein